METFVGRKRQESQLYQLITPTVDYPIIVVHGPPATGKTTLVKHVLQQKQMKNVYVSCQSIFTPKLIKHSQE